MTECSLEPCSERVASVLYLNRKTYASAALLKQQAVRSPVIYSYRCYMDFDSDICLSSWSHYEENLKAAAQLCGR